MCRGAWRSFRARTLGIRGTTVPRAEFGECSHRERRAARDPERHGEEAERFPGKSTEIAEVLDDENSGPEEACPSPRLEVGRVVDAPEIDTDERGTAADEEVEHFPFEVRPGLPIPRRPPALVPSRPDDDRPLRTVSLSSSRVSGPGCADP